MNEEKIKIEIKSKLTQGEDYIAPRVEGLPLSVYPTIEYIHSTFQQEKANANLSKKSVVHLKHRPSIQIEIKKLEELKEELRDNFISCNRAVLENRAAGSRLREKLSDDKNCCIDIEKQMKSVKDDIDKYKSVKSQMEAKVEQYSMFETFLRRVADTSGAFNSVRDVLNRFEMLETSRGYIADLLKRELEEADTLRQNMVNLVEEKATNFKKLGNELIMLEVARKEAKERRKFWESKMAKIKGLTVVKKEEAVVLKGACDDLYRKLCKSLGDTPTIPDGNFEAQLTYIQKGITYKKDVYSEALKRLQQAGTTAQAKNK